MRNLIGVLTAATLMVGCTAYSPFEPSLEISALLSSMGSVTLKATIAEGGYTTAAVVPNLTKSSVDHLRLALFSVEGDAEAPLKGADGTALVKTLTLEAAEAGFSIGGLPLGKTYRARVAAYKTAESLAEAQISAEAMAEFKLEKGKSSAEVSVQLMDVLFSGTASGSGIVVTPSGQLSHEGLVEIDFQPANPG